MEEQVHPKLNKIGSKKESTEESEELTAKIKQKLQKELLEILKKNSTEAEPVNVEKQVHPKLKKIRSKKEFVEESEEQTAKIKQKLPKESLEIMKKKSTIKDFFNSL